MLASLDQLPDFRIAPGDPDPRGWTLLVGAGTAAAEIDDLIVDPDAGRVCYLVCRITPDRAARLGHDHVLIPIGYARFDEEARAVIVDVIGDDELGRLPPFRGLPVPDAMDAAIHAVFTREDARPK